MDLKDLGLKETSVKAAMLRILSDGMPHTKQELHACCGPSSITAVETHVSALRPILKRYGMGIVCEVARYKKWYRQVRLIGRAAE